VVASAHVGGGGAVHVTPAHGSFTQAPLAHAVLHVVRRFS